MQQAFSIYSRTKGYWQCGGWSHSHEPEDATKYDSEQECNNVAAFRRLFDYEVVENAAPYQRLFNTRQRAELS